MVEVGLGVEFAHGGDVDQVRPVRLDESVERHPVLPAGVEIDHLHRAVRALTHLVLRPQQQPLLRRAVAFGDLLHVEAQDERPHHPEDERDVLLQDVLRGVLVGDLLRLQEVVDELERDVEVGDLLELARRVGLVLAERVVRDDLDELDEAHAVGEVLREVLHLHPLALEVRVHPRGERLHLHPLSRCVIAGHLVSLPLPPPRQ
mmetsp:Transcript_7860/g.18871  ORF Transcript_7860/g.18871 Transcript_7860/m.18871 type:complete len:204 (+) Transcript_7860:834-1445(+)